MECGLIHADHLNPNKETRPIPGFDLNLKFYSYRKEKDLKVITLA